MIDDKLSAEQRIRLEAIAQANIRLNDRPGGRLAKASEVVAELVAGADQIAKYIETGKRS